jgi:putative ABC transport system ATP-binding protein
MEIKLQSIIAIPLKDKLQQRDSAIWDKNIVFTPKQFVKIKAPSGTGKTTLIHQLYGIRNDYSGTIFYDDKNIKELNAETMADIRQQKLSVIFQDLRLFENLTAFENIELKRAIYKPFVSLERCNEMIDLLGIRHILQQPAKICSYGEQQRIAIVRALMQPFNWLLMDEPFSHLDQANTLKAANLIAEECAKRNAGFVLTDLDEDNNFNYTQYYNL